MYLRIATALAMVWTMVADAQDIRIATGDDAEAYARTTIDRIFPDDQVAPAPLLILGTFHFKDSGQDGYKPTFDVDILSQKRQAEIAGLVERLARFGPTRIAVERDLDRQAELDDDYRAYRAGRFELTSNEIHQLGFRLASRLGHERVYAVDADGAALPSSIDLEVFAREHGQEALLDDPVGKLYEQLYRHDDALKARLPLRDFLLYLNSDARLRTGHGHYVIGGFQLGAGDQYPGPDGFPSLWYNRNLRIFHNLMRLTADREQRILLVVGAGHVPILREQARSSPKILLEDVAQYLGE